MAVNQGTLEKNALVQVEVLSPRLSITKDTKKAKKANEFIELSTD